MSSTNKTTNYELSQYVGSDKPTYLGDYNGDMLKIDGQMKTNNTLAQNGKDTADLAETHAQTALTNAETADGKAVTAKGVADSALAKATQNEADIAKFNLVNFDATSYGDMTITTGTLSAGSITVATNSDNSIAKIYGRLKVTASNQNDSTNKIVLTSSLRPDTEITISSLGFTAVSTSTGLNAVDKQDIIIKTNGNIEIPCPINQYVTSTVIVLHPCLLFIKDFGDTQSN